MGKSMVKRHRLPLPLPLMNPRSSMSRARVALAAFGALTLLAAALRVIL